MSPKFPTEILERPARGSANMLQNVHKTTCFITRLTFTINKLVNIFVVSSLNLILRKYRHNDAFILLCSDQRIFTLKHDEILKIMKIHEITHVIQIYAFNPIISMHTVHTEQSIMGFNDQTLDKNLAMKIMGHFRTEIGQFRSKRTSNRLFEHVSYRQKSVEDVDLKIRLVNFD